jgi:hypothetical protein
LTDLIFEQRGTGSAAQSSVQLFHVASTNSQMDRFH